MNLHPATIDWELAHSIRVPRISRSVVTKLEESGIGHVFTGRMTMTILLLDEITDLATLHAILGGEYEQWKGTVDQLALLRGLVGYMESHQSLPWFCFIVEDD